MAPLEPLAVVGPHAEIADRLHKFGDLGIVYLRCRLHLVYERDRQILDILAVGAARTLEGKPLGTWPDEAFGG